MPIMTERYVRKPLYVDAVRVTEENFLELAFWCNGSIKNNDGTEGDRQVDPFNQHILVRVQNPKTPRQSRAHVGDWILRTGDPKNPKNKFPFKVFTDKAFQASYDRHIGEKILEQLRHEDLPKGGSNNHKDQEVPMEHEDTQAQDEQIERTETVTPTEPVEDQGAADSQQEPQQDSALQTPQADQPVPMPHEDGAPSA